MINLLSLPETTICPFGLGASVVAQIVKNLPPIQETQVRCLGWEDPLEKGMATHSSILAWRIQQTEESNGLHSMGSQRVPHDWVTFFWPVKSTLAPRPILFLSVVACGLVAKSCLTLETPRTVTYRLFCPWDFPGKNTGVSCHFLLEGIFQTQESNTSLLCYMWSPALQADALLAEPPGKPFIPQ